MNILSSDSTVEINYGLSVCVVESFLGLLGYVDDQEICGNP